MVDRLLTVALLVVLTVAGVGGTDGTVRAQGRATTEIVRDSVDHGPFTQLLQRFVDSAGDVDYAGLSAAREEALQPYLQHLATASLEGLSKEARLAFWMNAYNALTLHLIVEHYPVKNIWAITPGPAKPKDESPFALDVGRVADTIRTLDEIEHDIIRERFDEPRIHFALVCAAKSCPRLRREAFTGDDLEAQLDDQARTFLHNEQHNRIPAGPDRIALSRILKWYGSDFGSSTDALQQFIAQYFDGPVRAKLDRAEYEVTFRSYDWSLNDQSPPPAHPD